MWPKAITQVFEWIRGMFLKVCGRRKRLRSGLNTHENLVRRKRMRTNSSSSSTSRSSTPHRQPGPSRSRGPQSPRYPVPNRNRQRRFQPQRRSPPNNALAVQRLQVLQEWAKNSYAHRLPSTDEYIRRNTLIKRQKRKQQMEEMREKRARTRPIEEPNIDPSEIAMDEGPSSQPMVQTQPALQSQPTIPPLVHNPPLIDLNESENRPRSNFEKQWEAMLARARQEAMRTSETFSMPDATQDSREPMIDPLVSIPSLYPISRPHPLTERTSMQIDDDDPPLEWAHLLSIYIDDDLRTQLRNTVLADEGESPDIGIPAFTKDKVTDEDQKHFYAVQRSNDDRILFTVDNCDFMLKDVQTLFPNRWLNDNIINGYMRLLQQRDAELDNDLSCHFCKTFLFSKLYPNYNYENVRRWTLPKRLQNWGQSKKSVLECDLIFFPVNLHNSHWVLITADLRTRVIRYYDSLFHNESSAIALMGPIRRYLIDEAADKLNQTWNEDDFLFELAEPIPKQNNTSDCGVFVARFAKELSGQNRLDFKADEMDLYRMLIFKELESGRLL